MGGTTGILRPVALRPLLAIGLALPFINQKLMLDPRKVNKVFTVFHQLKYLIFRIHIGDFPTLAGDFPRSGEKIDSGGIIRW